MESLETPQLIAIGVGAVAAALIAWKLFKLAVKIVVFLVVVIVLAAGVALYLEQAPPRLPVSGGAQ